MTAVRTQAIGRRSLLQGASALAATSVLGTMTTQAHAQENGTPVAGALERRMLGPLEVTSIGLGVQNMSRKYDTTTPYRPEMIALIRAAYNQGVRFFDTAEAYGPFECERILGEAIQPFRDEVVITSKFG